MSEPEDTRLPPSLEAEVLPGEPNVQLVGRLPMDVVATAAVQRHARLAFSPVTLNKEVIERSARVTILALRHLERRLRAKETPDRIKDRLAKSALILAPKMIAEIRLYMGEQGGNREGNDAAAELLQASAVALSGEVQESPAEDDEEPERAAR